MHRMDVDPATGLVEIEVEGFWDREHVDLFARDLTAATTQARSCGRNSVVLCDYTRASIQPQEVVAALQQVVREPSRRSRRVALYTGGRLATMQARRVAAVRDDMRVFDDRGAALAWLME